MPDLALEHHRRLRPARHPLSDPSSIRCMPILVQSTPSCRPSCRRKRARRWRRCWRRWSRFGEAAEQKVEQGGASRASWAAAASGRRAQGLAPDVRHAAVRASCGACSGIGTVTARRAVAMAAHREPETASELAGQHRVRHRKHPCGGACGRVTRRQLRGSVSSERPLRACARGWKRPCYWICPWQRLYFGSIARAGGVARRCPTSTDRAHRRRGRRARPRRRGHRAAVTGAAAPPIVVDVVLVHFLLRIGRKRLRWWCHLQFDVGEHFGHLLRRRSSIRLEAVQRLPAGTRVSGCAGRRRVADPWAQVVEGEAGASSTTDRGSGSSRLFSTIRMTSGP